jgi:pimeloyl-ACP methyl ester carboxylesterase
MNRPTTGMLRVPEASLYYAVRGAGPPLLIAQGGAGDADAAGDLVSQLAGSYTVVTYDRRGQGRSPLDDPGQALRVEAESDDIHRLLATLTAEPACVFGSSFGGVIALDLAARHPEGLRTVVAHEPPAPYLLGEIAPRPEGFIQTARREGAASALNRFAATIGVRRDGERGMSLSERTPRAEANGSFFLEREARMLRNYRLDIPALRAAPVRIVLAGGEAGREHWPYRSAVAVADLLGTTLVDFPGHHAGYVTHPRAFAARLQELLEDARSPIRTDIPRMSGHGQEP